MQLRFKIRNEYIHYFNVTDTKHNELSFSLDVCGCMYFLLGSVVSVILSASTRTNSVLAPVQKQGYNVRYAVDTYCSIIMYMHIHCTVSNSFIN